MSEPTFRRKFTAWLDGEREPRDQTLFVMERRPPRPQISPEEHAKKEKHLLRRFLETYPVASVVIGVVLIAVLLYAVVQMPGFGQPGNPLNNEVAEHYLEYTEEETGATNAVTGMILAYRGFDTLGESCVLFLAVCCVLLLLNRDEHNTDERDLQRLRQEEELEERNPDLILQQAARILTPFLFLFAIYVLLNGETSPGGGFSGGTILGSGLVLYACAFGAKKMNVFFSARIYHTVRTVGLTVYALVYGYSIFMGANGLDSHLGHHGLTTPIEISVGLVVACTVYGFFALFKRGSLH